MFIMELDGIGITWNTTNGSDSQYTDIDLISLILQSNPGHKTQI